MKISHAAGNTWYIEGKQLIPLYMLDRQRCVLLDSGMLEERAEIEDSLCRAGITPAGILGTHIHTDHSPNNGYFQEKYSIPVALPFIEAAFSSSLLGLKSYLFMLSPARAAATPPVAAMEFMADRIIMPHEREIVFCGANFGIIHTPGHSPGHICVTTPDGVLYLGDALLTEQEIEGARLPYFFSIQDTLNTMEALRSVQAPYYLAAHRGLYTDISHWLDVNISVIGENCRRVARLIDRPMTLDGIYQRVCSDFLLLSSNLRKAAVYERNIRVYAEHLRDTGEVAVWAENGLVKYGPKQ